MNNFLALSLLILCVCTKRSTTSDEVQISEACEQEAQGKVWYDDDNCIKHTCTSGFVIDSKCPTLTNTEETCFINLYPGGSFPDCCPKLLCDDDTHAYNTPEEHFEVTTPQEEHEVSTPEEEFQASTPEEHEVSTPEEEFQATTPEEHEVSTPEEELEVTTPEEEHEVTTPEEEYEVSTPEEEFEVSTLEGDEEGSGSGSGLDVYPDLEEGGDDSDIILDGDEVGSGSIFYPDLEESSGDYEITFKPTEEETIFDIPESTTTDNPNYYEVETEEGLKIHLTGDAEGNKFGLEIEPNGMGSEEELLVELLHYFDGKKFEIEIEKHREKKKDLIKRLLHKLSHKNFGVVVEKSSNN